VRSEVEKEGEHGQSPSQQKAHVRIQVGEKGVCPG
jgi:hypothetical protein